MRGCVLTLVAMLWFMSPLPHGGVISAETVQDAQEEPGARRFEIDGIRLGMTRPEVVAAAERSSYSTNPEVGTQFTRPGAKRSDRDSPVIEVKYYATSSGANPAHSVRWTVFYGSGPDPERSERLYQSLVEKFGKPSRTYSVPQNLSHDWAAGHDGWNELLQFRATSLYATIVLMATDIDRGKFSQLGRRANP